MGAECTKYYAISVSEAIEKLFHRLIREEIKVKFASVLNQLSTTL
jgi:hypothetical protein